MGVDWRKRSILIMPGFFQAVTAAGYASAPAPGIVTSGLLISYDPNKAGGYNSSTLFDLVGSEDLSLYNGASVTLPFTEFDGVNDRAYIANDYVPSSVQFNFTDSFTYGVWVRPDFGNNDGAGVVVGPIQYQGNFRSCSIIAGVGGARLTPRFWFRASSSQYMMVVSNVPMVQGQPVYLSATYSGSRSSSAWKFYINGVEVSFTLTNVGTSTTAMNYTGASFMMGAQETVNHWHGGVGAAHIYDRALTASEVLQNYNATKDDYVIVTDGLVLHLDAGNTSSYPGSGTTWYDLTTNNYDGTLTNGPTYNSANGGYIEFDGVNDYVDLTSFVIPSEITVSVWVKPDVISSTMQLATSDDSVQVIRNWQFRLDSDGTVRVIAFHTASPNNVQVQTTDTLTAGDWAMVTFTVDGSNLKIYFNGGVEKASSSFPYNILGNGNAGFLLLGARKSTNYADFLNGNIPTCMVYDRALTATEITQNYNATKGNYGL